jgi:hypothetical protein
MTITELDQARTTLPTSMTNDMSIDEHWDSCSVHWGAGCTCGAEK